MMVVIMGSSGEQEDKRGGSLTEALESVLVTLFDQLPSQKELWMGNKRRECIIL